MHAYVCGVFIKLIPKQIKYMSIKYTPVIQENPIFKRKCDIKQYLSALFVGVPGSRSLYNTQITISIYSIMYKLYKMTLIIHHPALFNDSQYGCPVVHREAKLNSPLCSGQTGILLTLYTYLCLYIYYYVYIYIIMFI